jgi:hypothetical protein
MTSGANDIGEAGAGTHAAVAPVVAGGVLDPVDSGSHEGAHEGGHGACANCGAALAGAYCHACGQNSHLHRTLAGFGHDLLHGVFHFEGKFWDTLPLLILKPGELTRRYIHGERAKFISPVAAFLCCVFLMFVVVGNLAGRGAGGADEAVGSGLKVTTSVELQAELAEAEAAIKTLDGRIAAGKAAGRPSAALEAERADQLSEVQGLRAVAPYVGEGRIGAALTRVNTPWPALTDGIRRIGENPGLFLYRLKTSAYKFSWVLIPISTPLLWLLFCWRREYRLYDHLVFVTFSLTFMMLLVTLVTLLGAIGLGGSWLVAAMMIIPPLHMYRQLRGAYLCSRWGALLRTVLLVVLSGVALSLYLLLLLAMGVFQ